MSRYRWKIAVALVVASTLTQAEAQSGITPQPFDPVSLMAQVKEASGGSAWDNVHSLHLRGTAIHGGLSRNIEEWDDVATGRFVARSASLLSSGAEGYDGVSSWVETRDGSSYLKGDQDSRLGAVDEAYRVSRAFWYSERMPSSLQSMGEAHESNRSFYVVSMTPAGGRPFAVWIDEETKLLDRFVEQQAESVMVRRFSDYRVVRGIRLPFHIEEGRQGDKQERYDIQTVATVDFEAPDSTLFSLPTKPALDFMFPPGQHSTTLPFQLTADNEIVVKVTVNGKGPFPAEFDSGGGFILGPSVAGQLSLRAEGTNQSYGGGEGSVTSGRAVVNSLGVGDIRLTQQHVRVFDVFPGEPDKMLVGSELLQRFVIRFDFDKLQMTLTDPAYFLYQGAGVEIPFHFQSNQPEVYGALDGIAGSFTVDTGDNGSLLLLAPFAKRFNLYDQYHSVIPYGGSAVGGATYGTMARTGVITLFGQDGRSALGFQHQVAQLSRQSGGYDADRYVSGNLGLALLKETNVTFDYPHQRIFLEKNHLYDQAVPYNRTGLHIKVDGARWIVTACDPNSPAAEADIKPGDHISNINGLGPGKLDAPSLYALLRQSPGTRLSLQVRSGPQSRSVNMILRDLL